MTVNQNSSQPLGISHATAIVLAGGITYVLDNGPNSNSPSTNGQLLAYTVGTNGALQAQPNGVFADDPAQTNPIYIIAEANSGGKFLYVANQGDNTNTNNAQSGIAAYTVTSAPYGLSPIANGGQTSGIGAGPQCLLEDPSNQFVYTANFNSSTVTGLVINRQAGNLSPLNDKSKTMDSFAIPGPAAWCVVTGRTS